MIKLPKPIPRNQILRTLENYERTSDEIVPLSKEFSSHCEDVWDLKEVTQKELVALHESLTKKAGKRSFLLVHLSI